MQFHQHAPCKLPTHPESLGCIGTHARAHGNKPFNPYTGGTLNQ